MISIDLTDLQTVTEACAAPAPATMEVGATAKTKIARANIQRFKPTPSVNPHNIALAPSLRITDEEGYLEVTTRAQVSHMNCILGTETKR